MEEFNYKIESRVINLSTSLYYYTTAEHFENYGIKPENIIPMHETQEHIIELDLEISSTLLK